MNHFQHAMTRDPEVVAAIERNRVGRAAMHDKACAFSQKYGDDPLGGYYDGSFAGRHRPSAIVSKTKPTAGQWKRGPRGFGWAPYAKNPLSAEFEALLWQDEEVPGLPPLMMSPGRMHTPQPFLWDGAVWVGLSAVPDDGEFGPQWEEVRASQWHAAREAVIDAEKKTEEAS